VIWEVIILILCLSDIRDSSFLEIKEKIDFPRKSISSQNLEMIRRKYQNMSWQKRRDLLFDEKLFLIDAGIDEIKGYF
jgi:hypothetical protein